MLNFEQNESWIMQITDGCGVLKIHVVDEIIQRG